jgi:glycosyltransferase involved in cell wall biosynthesis
MNPLISIIVPVYNVEKYLSKCLDSIVNQTYKNLEIILIDDGSTDNSGDICDEYANKDNRIKVIHKSNGGISDARNKGLDIAKGEYIGFVDSDDYIAEDMYEYLYNFVIENDLDVAMCASCNVYQGKIIYHKNFESIILDKKEKIIENIFINPSGGSAVSVWGKLFKYNVIKDIRFDFGKTCEDVYFVLKWIENTNKFGRCDKAKYYYVQREGSITHQKFYNDEILDVVYGYQKNYKIISRKYPDLIKVAEFRLWWACKSAIEKIYVCEDANNYKDIIKTLQIKLKINMIKILLNKYITTKSKLAYFLLANDIRIYFKIKEFC